ncbi:hypothetical protein [Ruminococcus sp. YE282]|uniref:hypothetical protein n=1 Tax=Ruminococcus sp. YE282 TaxID=3158780 RepID=UPI0008801A93|nr:hypothetical protein SAMN02910441_00150 [Ruminococcus bromii]
MIVLNEKDYAIEHLESGDVGEKPFFTLSMIAKYYYHCLGYKKSKINKLLNEFMQKNYFGYQNDKLTWEETIDKIVRNVNRYELLELAGVSITESELEKIATLDNPEKERVMFTILCLAKLGQLRNPNSDGWVNESTKDIFKMARVSSKRFDRELCIGELTDNGFLELPLRNANNSVRVTFIDNEGEQKLLVSDFRELGYEYLKYKGGNFIRCAECGILTRGNKYGNKKYCNNCKSYNPMLVKIIKCIDCGKEFEVNSKDNCTCRCDTCNLEYKRKYYREYRRNQREKQKK